MKIGDVLEEIKETLRLAHYSKEEAIERAKLKVEIFKLEAQLEQNELLRKISSELHNINDKSSQSRSNKQFRVKSQSACVIENYFDWNEPAGAWRFYSCRELAELFDLPTTRGLTAMMRSINQDIKMTQKYVNGKKCKGFILPSHEDDEDDI